MGVVASYSRDQWYDIGGFAGVEPYVSVVELLFFDWYDEDEDTEWERTEKVFIRRGERIKKITTSATRPYRVYERDFENEDTWIFTDEGKRLVTDDLLVNMGKRKVTR